MDDWFDDFIEEDMAEGIAAPAVAEPGGLHLGYNAAAHYQRMYQAILDEWDDEEIIIYG